MIRKVEKKIDCLTCISSLRSVRCQEMSLLSLRNRGGLIVPSDGVVKVLITAEKCLRSLAPDIRDMKHLKSHHFLDLRVESATVKHFYENRCIYELFPSLKGRVDSSAIEETDHVTFLIRLIVNIYTRVRLFRYGKKFTCQHIHGSKPTIRTKLNKIVLFRNE